MLLMSQSHRKEHQIGGSNCDSHLLTLIYTIQFHHNTGA